MKKPAPALSPNGQLGSSPSSLRTIGALILREMSTVYGKNPGGYLWAIVEPLGGILIMALGFSLLLRSPSLGSSFILFYASGFVPFLFYQDIARVTAFSLSYSKALLRYPVVSWIDAVLARVILYTLTGTVVAAIIMSCLLIYLEHNAALHLEYLVLAYLGALLMGTGVGLINCVLFGVWPIWQTIWGIVVRPLFLASGVLFIWEDLPTFAQDILWYNPLFHLTTTFRQGIYPTYSPQFVSLPLLFGSGIVLTAFGLLLLKRFHLQVLEKR